MNHGFGLMSLCAASLLLLAACEQEVAEEAAPVVSPPMAEEAAELPTPEVTPEVLASVAKQLETAGVHAGAAAGTDDLAMAKMHLQHTVNCLVGPDGELYDAAAGDPCTGQGTGILNELPADSDAYTAAELALTHASKGAAAAGIATAQELANETVGLLAQAAAAL